MKLDGTLMVIAPHQDDEVLGCGWLMRRVTDAGGPVVVVWLTDGGASHGERSPAARAGLVATRQAEALAGLTALGIRAAATYFLGFPDGGLAKHIAEARTRLAAIVATHSIDTLCVTGGGDSHLDHQAAFEIAAGLTGIAVYAYPVSGRYDGDPPDLPADAIVVDEPRLVAAKRAALACHTSQTAAGGARYPLSAAAIDAFCAGPEIFVAVSP